jgi:hypothetical protein
MSSRWAEYEPLPSMKVDVDADVLEVLQVEVGDGAVLPPAVEPVPDVEVPKALTGMTRNPEAARAAQAKSRESFRENRRRKQEANEQGALEAVQNIRDDIMMASESTLSRGDIPEMADKVVRLTLSTILAGGDLFLPRTGKEAMEMGKQAAAIAANYRGQRQMDRVIEGTATEVAGRDAMSALHELQQELKRRALRFGQTSE